MIRKVYSDGHAKTWFGNVTRYVVRGASRKGVGRSLNQDRFLVHGRIVGGSETEEVEEIVDDHSLIIVADGMGGHEDGEVASNLALRSLKESISRILAPDFDLVAVAVQKAHQELKDNQLRFGARPMGTTIAGLWLHAKSAIWFNVGDSRVYQFTDGEAVQLSKDDKYDSGAFKSSVITQCIGPANLSDPKPHIGEVSEPADGYVLVSDGISDFVSAELISRAFFDEGAVPSDVCDLAAQAGGTDDMTCISVIPWDV